MAKNNEIPEGAEKILFAENFVGYMMFRLKGIYYPASRSAPYRDVLYQAFNESVQRATIFLDATMGVHHDDIYYFKLNPNKVSKETYITRAEGLAEKYFLAGFNANNFLPYCVHLSSLAIYFYNHKVLEALDLAVTYICKVVKEYDMTNGGWKTLHSIAEQYESMAQYSANMILPESSSADLDISQNAAKNLDKLHSENIECKSNLAEGSLNVLAVNKDRLIKHHLIQKELTDVPRQRSKCKWESKDISNDSQKSQMTSGMVVAKTLNDSSCSKETELSGKNLKSLKIKHPTWSSSFNAHKNLKSGEQSSTNKQKVSMDNEENFQASSRSETFEVKPDLSQFGRYSPISDDENSFPNQGNNFQVSNAKPNISHFEKYSPISDDENSCPNQVNYLQALNSKPEPAWKTIIETLMENHYGRYNLKSDENDFPNQVNNLQASDVKPYLSHFGRYSPISDDENSCPNQSNNLQASNAKTELLHFGRYNPKSDENDFPNQVNNFQAWDVKPDLSHFERYSPISDDEIGFLNEINNT